MLQMYAIALLGIGIHRVMVPIFYALDDPMTPMWAGLATVALKYPVAIWLVHRIGVDGLPLSHAILVTLEISFLLVVVCRRVPGITTQILSSHLKAFAAGGIMVLALWQTRDMATGIGFLPLSAIGCGFYLVVASLLGVPEAKRITARLTRGPRRPPRPPN
jgi:peptidoglycan biosynthesis protein MviN/MurJ (putative lipid II flippase)